MENNNYKEAYLRQKKARELAEQLLESRSSELYEANQELRLAYDKLKNQKSQILHQEKLASIGQLAAGVAHEINNPNGYVKSNLNTLKNYSQMMLDAISALENCVQQNDEGASKVQAIRDQFDLEYIKSDMDELICESLDGISRIEDIVKSLKSFAQPDKDEPVPFDVNLCVESTLKLVGNEVKYKANLIKKLPDVPLVLGQSGSISQVVLNLIVNAAQAMKDHGEITISTEFCEPEVIIEVSDNGCGISEADQKKIFDPFYSTKDIGTGLGLSVSHGIVKKHGGRIAVSSELGKGSTFKVFLPATKSC